MTPPDRDDEPAAPPPETAAAPAPAAAAPASPDPVFALEPSPGHDDATADPVDAAPVDPIAEAGEAGEADEAAATLRRSRLPSILESLLFVGDRPLSAVELAQLVAEPDVTVVARALSALAAEATARGVHLHEVAGAWQFRSSPENAAWVQRLLAQKPVRLTRSQLETLAIVAYRQPITRPEIDEIRGVDTGGTLKTLLDRTLVRILGKKEEPGRPLLYGSTKEFLEFFNLRDLRELPTLREFHELSDEHRAQVEALEKAAPPGSIERPIVAPANEPLPPLQRIDVTDEHIEEDLDALDALINAADSKARAAAKAFGGTEAPVDNPALDSTTEKEWMWTCGLQLPVSMWW